VKKDGFLSKSAEASSPVMRSFPAQTKAFRWCFYHFSSVVCLFLPTNFFVGIFSFTACSYTR
jgi:hypothetical protein